MADGRMALACAAAALTALVLAGRWWAARSKRQAARPATAQRQPVTPSTLSTPSAKGSDHTAARTPVGPDQAALTVIREAERHVEQAWQRIQPLYDTRD